MEHPGSEAGRSPLPLTPSPASRRHGTNIENVIGGSGLSAPANRAMPAARRASTHLAAFSLLAIQQRDDSLLGLAMHALDTTLATTAPIRGRTY